MAELALVPRRLLLKVPTSTSFPLLESFGRCREECELGATRAGARAKTWGLAFYFGLVLQDLKLS